MYETAQVGVVTALPKEFAALCTVLECRPVLDSNGFVVARVPSLHDGTVDVVVTQLEDVGNNMAAAMAARMLAMTRVNNIIMTGIAAAVPDPGRAEDHVRLGDIVISSRHGVVQYDLVKETVDAVTHRNPPNPPSAALTAIIGQLRAGEAVGQRPWETIFDRALGRLDVAIQAAWARPGSAYDVLQDNPNDSPTVHPVDVLRRSGAPRVFYGPIASANRLLKNPAIRDALRDRFNVRAVEMEGSGIADATWQRNTGYLVVRGTCDYANMLKDNVWQNYASLIAAAYTRAVIELVHPLEQPMEQIPSPEQPAERRPAPEVIGQACSPEQPAEQIPSSERPAERRAAPEVVTPSCEIRQPYAAILYVDIPDADEVLLRFERAEAAAATVAFKRTVEEFIGSNGGFAHHRDPHGLLGIWPEDGGTRAHHVRRLLPGLRADLESWADSPAIRSAQENAGFPGQLSVLGAATYGAVTDYSLNGVRHFNGAPIGRAIALIDTRLSFRRDTHHRFVLDEAFVNRAGFAPAWQGDHIRPVTNKDRELLGAHCVPNVWAHD